MHAIQGDKMKAVGQLRILNQQPYILITHHDLCAIQHIVDIAPKEAQWFHRLEKLEEDGQGIGYRLYEMFIPEQWCSGTEVSSDPEMFLKMYKELVKNHGQETTNDILKTMTVWCHSHHTMGVNPSSQDIKQFKEQCDKALEDKINLPQVMMIFNKKNQYYCRIWDPDSGLMLENVELIVGNYDFDWIDKEAKAKFKQKKIIQKGTVTHGWHGGQQGLIDFNNFELNPPSNKKAKKKPTGKKGGKKGRKQKYSPISQLFQ